MTILPKKKPPGGSKNETESVEGGGGGYQLGIPNNQVIFYPALLFLT